MKTCIPRTKTLSTTSSAHWRSSAVAQNSHGWPTRSCQKIRPEQTPLKLPSSLVRSPQFENIVFCSLLHTHRQSVYSQPGRRRLCRILLLPLRTHSLLASRTLCSDRVAIVGERVVLRGGEEKEVTLSAHTGGTEM